MRPLIATLVAATFLASPVQAGTAELFDKPSQLSPEWQKQTRDLLEQVIEIPTVPGRGETPRMAKLLADRLMAAGIPASDIQILPYEATKGDHTVALIARWRSPKPTKKPILVMGHMDVVEAKREDWERDPFEFIEEDGYFYGRGTSDMKNGIVSTLMAVLKLKAAGYKPNRDIILFYSGDEETLGVAATNGATGEWKELASAEYGLNADGVAGAYDRDGKPLGFFVSTAEKTYQSYRFVARNKGGHSSAPRPDNAIYDLADALKALEKHRFTPRLNDSTRAYFAKRAKDEGDTPLGNAMRAWLANEQDGAAADAVEASELEVGKTRTRCVATMLQGGHADNALPQRAEAVVNCRIIPGETPAGVMEELKAVAGSKAEVVYYDDFRGVPSPPSPLRKDVFGAIGRAVAKIYGPGMDVVPVMAVGASDGSFFRSAGTPVYDIGGSWMIAPEDERAHGLNERIPVRAMYDDVVYWEMVLKELSSGK